MMITNVDLSRYSHAEIDIIERTTEKPHTIQKHIFIYHQKFISLFGFKIKWGYKQESILHEVVELANRAWLMYKDENKYDVELVLINKESGFRIIWRNGGYI